MSQKAPHNETREFCCYLLAFLLVCAIARPLWHWWHTPPAVEYANLKYLQLLRTAVSSRDEGQLAAVESVLTTRHEEGKLSQREYSMFCRVCATAKQGKWKHADAEALRFEKAQLSRKRTTAPIETREAEDHGH